VLEAIGKAGVRYNAANSKENTRHKASAIDGIMTNGECLAKITEDHFLMSDESTQAY
jgi:hypothetical protein